MDENLTRGYVQLGRDSPSVAEKLTRSSHLQPPEDRCRCIYFALILAGAGFLLPYNSFIIAVDYYQERYPGTTVVFDMSLVYILIAFVAVILNNILIEAFTLHTRITFGYLLSFFTLLFVALCEIWFEMFSQHASYNINLIAVAVVAFGCTDSLSITFLLIKNSVIVIYLVTAGCIVFLNVCEDGILIVFIYWTILSSNINIECLMKKLTLF